jgi:hypothetical protein
MGSRGTPFYFARQLRLVSFAFPAATGFDRSEQASCVLSSVGLLLVSVKCQPRRWPIDDSHGGGNCQGFLDSWALTVLARLSGDEKEFCEHVMSLVLMGNRGCSRNRFREHREVNLDRESVAQVL